MVGVLRAATATNATLVGTGFDFNARLQLQINTTSSVQAVSVARVDIASTAATPPVANQTVNLSSGTISLLIAGRLQLKQGTGASQTNAFFADANFILTSSGTTFSMSADARVDVQFLGRMTGTFSVTISSAGMAGVVRLANHANSTLNGVGFRVNGYLSLEFNTSGSAGDGDQRARAVHRGHRFHFQRPNSLRGCHHRGPRRSDLRRRRDPTARRGCTDE
jgi:hypothetical protein